MHKISFPFQDSLSVYKSRFRADAVRAGYRIFHMEVNITLDLAPQDGNDKNYKKGLSEF